MLIWMSPGMIQPPAEHRDEQSNGQAFATDSHLITAHEPHHEQRMLIMMWRLSPPAASLALLGAEPQRIFNARRSWPDLSGQRLFQFGFELAHGLNARL